MTNSADPYPAVTIEDGAPSVFLNVSVPDDDDDAPPASRKTYDAAMRHFPGADFGDITQYQAEALAAYGRFGYRFGRTLFVRNSYKAKDMIGSIIAGYVSSKVGLAMEVLRWDDANSLLNIHEPDVTEMRRFSSVHLWVEGFVEHAARHGWVLNMDDDY